MERRNALCLSFFVFPSSSLFPFLPSPCAIPAWPRRRTQSPRTRPRASPVFFRRVSSDREAERRRARRCEFAVSGVADAQSCISVIAPVARDLCKSQLTFAVIGELRYAPIATRRSSGENGRVPFQRERKRIGAFYRFSMPPCLSNRKGLLLARSTPRRKELW